MLPLPAKPAFDPAHPAAYFVNAAKLYNAWRRRRVSNPFAIGLGVTQADMESSFRSNVVGDHGVAFNFYQWHWSPRGAAILAATGIDVRTETDIDRIVEAAWWELVGPHGTGGVEKHAFAAVSGCFTSADAARAACIYFEGAGAADAAQRRAQDADFWVNFITRNFSWVFAQG